MRRRARTIVVAAAAVVGLLPVPGAGDVAAASCRPFRSTLADGRTQGPLRVSPQHNERRPLTVRYDIGATVGINEAGTDNDRYFALQTMPDERKAKLNITFEFTPASEFQTQLFDHGNREVAHGNYRLVQLGQDEIRDVPATRCAGFTLKSRAVVSAPTTVTIDIWLD